MEPVARTERYTEEIRHRLGCPFLTEVEAAAYLRIARSTLAQHRTKGDGPPFRKHFGGIAYHIDDLELWSSSRRRISTSDLGESAAGRVARLRKELARAEQEQAAVNDRLNRSRGR
jgi:hypothetical protein